MKRAIVAGVLLMGAVIWAWKDRAPHPAEVQPVIYPTPAPTLDEPLEPIKPQGYDDPTQPAPPLPAAPHWGRCSGFRGLQANEDAALREVLASTVDDDPLFGGREIRMEQAECAAYRERIAGERVGEGSVGIPPRRG